MAKIKKTVIVGLTFKNQTLKAESLVVKLVLVTLVIFLLWQVKVSAVKKGPLKHLEYRGLLVGEISDN